jgi:hypothetical protein
MLLSASKSAVIVRLDRTIQYAAASRLDLGVSGILDPRWSLSSGGAPRRPGGGDDKLCPGMTSCVRGDDGLCWEC